MRSRQRKDVRRTFNWKVGASVIAILSIGASCGGDKDKVDPEAAHGASNSEPEQGSSVDMAHAESTSESPVLDLDSAPVPGAWFRNEALARGLDFTYDSGHRDKYWFPEIVGGGAALFDMDQDGDLDVYLVQGGPIDLDPAERDPNHLYANDGSGLFDDVTSRSGAGDRGYGMGVAAGDMDNDGRQDLYVTNVGPNVLLWNTGEEDGPYFQDQSQDSGAQDGSWGVSTAFLDYDADGFLDLFVANYVYWSMATERQCLQPTYGPDYCSPNSYEAPAPDTLLHNLGNGTFQDVSLALGIRTAFGNGLGCATADFDLNGWIDIFVANDGMENQLWMNQAGQSYRNEALKYGVAVDDDGKKKAGMGAAVVDLDDDRDPDLIVVNLDTESDSLFENRGHYFKDSSARYGLRVATRSFTRWGVGFRDFNNDGFLDLFQANGRVERALDIDRSNFYAEANTLLAGGGSKAYFHPTAFPGGTSESLIRTSRAAVFGDIDADGGVDILVINRDAPVSLLHNQVADQGAYLSVRLVDDHDRDALGALLAATLADGRVLTRRVRSDSSYCAANDPLIHLGLGDRKGVQELMVTWLDGTQESFGARSADQHVTLRRGEGTAQ